MPKIHNCLQKTLTNFEDELEFLFIIDLECTCDENNKIDLYEIIEFPILVLELKKVQIVNTFHTFVKPTHNPILT